MALIIDAVVAEAEKAEKRFGPFTSTHEAYGVLAEEMAELLDAIRANTAHGIQAEAQQVAAVALRLADHCRIAINDAYQSPFAKRSGF